jgi:4-amino-4-deoxychorismate lyase
MTPEGVWVNGVPEAQIAVSDRAVQYGDGLFETIRIVGGRPQFLARHLERLKGGCTRLGIAPVPWDTLSREIRELAARHNGAVLKVIVSRGSGTRGYRVRAGGQATRIMSLSALPEWSADIDRCGARLRICSTRLAFQPALAGIKHLNRLEQILARSEWDDPEISEGLMLSHDNLLVEGTMSNLFLVSGDRLLTPDLSGCGVAGVMRSVILDFAAQQGIPHDITTLTLDDAGSADEVFVCNSLIGIWPVCAIDGIGNYGIGRMTRMLSAAPGFAGDDEEGGWYSW